MSGKKKAGEIEKAAARMRERDVEDAVRAIALRRTGTGWGTIARSLGRTQVEVEELARVGYEHLLGQQDPDLIRAEVEDRQDQIIRQANIDLASAETIAERNACYRTILAADAARVRMLGLTIKAGADDA
ncbi:hypothetical protein [Microbacterium sp. CJ77]|uniref:hypothetical protein n=1 Tax=Microbacterium sp. CJ77 TaxID=2079201 RepID=UPI000CD94921|nr:hypothetical protein [Microbacterium sp. CJ77]